MHERVAEFYAGKKLLITGGTGFMGKVLVEKTLRSCPDVDTIYLIVREKKGKSIEKRWKEITELPLFDKLKMERPENLNKIKLVRGDLRQDNFGISSDHLEELKENIEIIFHAAADVQFSESINDALIENVKAVKTFLDLAKTMTKLKVFVHISTAYSNHNRDPSKAVEKIIPPCQNWKVLLKLQETEPRTLQLLKEKLLCGHPNPYTWSKSLAEQIVNEYSIYFPVVVMRPSIVVGCFREDPIEGWQDALGGYGAIALGIVLGIVRVLKTKGEYHNDHIPVDIASRAELIAAKKAVETNTRVSVYNCGTAKILPLPNLKVFKCAKKLEEKRLIKEKVWVSDVLYIDNEYLYPVAFVYRQVIPAMFLDMLLKLSGQKPIFMKLSKKVAIGNKSFSRFLNSKIIFPTDNFLTLENYLSVMDKEQFSIDISDLIYKRQKIIEDANKGMLLYVLKTELTNESIERLRPRFERIKLLRKILFFVEYSAFGWLAWSSMMYFINKLNFIS